MRVIAAAIVLSISSFGCSESSATDDLPVVDSGSVLDGGETTLDSTPTDTGANEVSTFADSGSSDTARTDAGASDTGSTDTSDTATSDSGSGDTATSDTGSIDSGSDALADTAPADPCSPLPSGLTTWTRTDTASVGTPDTYFFDVTPGDPFCVTITGGGSGSWSVNVSNGTSSGLYCAGSNKCSIVVPAGQMTLLVTAVTTDIGGYTLTVRYRPRV